MKVRGETPAVPGKKARRTPSRPETTGSRPPKISLGDTESFWAT